MTHQGLVRIIAFFVVIFFIAPTFALAAAGLPGQIVPEQCNQVGGCQSVCDLATVAQNVLNTGIYIAVFLSAVLFAWAGWLYLTSVAGGEISRAKEIFVNVAIGLVIILAGWLVVDTLMRTLVGNGGSFGPWNKICALFVQQVSAFV